MADLSEAQIGAIRKAKELIGEHFESYVILTLIEDEDPNDQGNTNELVFATHGGGYYNALGILSDAHYAYQTRQGFSKPEVNDGIGE